MFLPGIRFRIRLDNGKRLTTFLTLLPSTVTHFYPLLSPSEDPFALSTVQNFVAQAIKSGEFGGLGNQSMEVEQDRQRT